MSNQLQIVEALLFACQEPISAEKLAEFAGLADQNAAGEAIAGLNQKYQECAHSFRIRQIAGGYQIYTLPEYSPWIETMFLKIKKQRLSKAALETLSIIAYKQPVTKVDIDLIRGVQSDAAVKTLLERELIAITGRSQSIGRPLLYGTTQGFLIHFGLRDLTELPKLEEMEFITGPAPAAEELTAGGEFPIPALAAESPSPYPGSEGL